MLQPAEGQLKRAGFDVKGPLLELYYEAYRKNGLGRPQQQIVASLLDWALGFKNFNKT
jgi:hypothetical protein